MNSTLPDTNLHLEAPITKIYTILISYPSGEFYSGAFKSQQGILDSITQHIQELNKDNKTLHLYPEHLENYLGYAALGFKLNQETYMTFSNGSWIFINLVPLLD